MSFKVNGALFKQTEESLRKRFGDRYDASKSYPEFDGVLNVPADQAYALAQYLMNATPNGDRQEIPIRLSGWSKTASSGNRYLSLAAEPDFKTLKGIEEAAGAQRAAQSLAQSTSGVVIQEDVF